MVLFDPRDTRVRGGPALEDLGLRKWADVRVARAGEATRTGGGTQARDVRKPAFRLGNSFQSKLRDVVEIGDGGLIVEVCIYISDAQMQQQNRTNRLVYADAGRIGGDVVPASRRCRTRDTIAVRIGGRTRRLEIRHRPVAGNLQVGTKRVVDLDRRNGVADLG